MAEPGRVAPRPSTGVRVRVPASSANLGPGFDSVGLALGVWDSCEVRVVAEPGLRITVTGEGAAHVPTDGSHLVVRSMRHAWVRQGVDAPDGLELLCHNAVPHGRGMGSSAAAIVTGVAAAFALTDLAGGGDGQPTLDGVNDIASALEGHPDNASASVYGGLTLSWSDDHAAPDHTPPHTNTARLRPHPDVVPVVFVPSEQLSTATARSVLPAQVRHGDAAANSARAALLVHALTTTPAYLLPGTRDWLHQEPRRGSFPASMELVDRLRAAGHAATISGAGPSVLALTTVDLADEVAAMAGEQWDPLRPGVPESGVQVVVLQS